MKKLMIAAAIVCAAVGAQAAATDWVAVADWTVNDVYDWNKINLESPEYVGANNYATFLVIATEDFGVDEMKKALEKGDYSWMTEQRVQTPKAAMENGSAGNQTPVWFEKNEMVNAFGVIFNNADYKNADHVYVTALANDKVGGEGQAASLAIDGSGTWQPSAWMETSAVPEPTSGILLLLGVAGLALRRRRA